MNDVALVIPTYRIEHASRVVSAYAHNFARYGHEVPIIVFDDSGHQRSQQSAGQLRYISNPGGVFYAGPEEKAAFLDRMAGTLGADVPARALGETFKPSYGGNRNFTVAYTLGGMCISVDDDMRPHALLHNTPEGLHYPEVAKGVFVHVNSPTYRKEEQDIAGAFLQFLGKPVSAFTGSGVPVAAAVRDDMTDLYTNTTVGSICEGRSNALSLVDGHVNPNARIKIAQTFRTGSYDVDAHDYAEEFLRPGGPEMLAVNDMSIKYVQKAHRPFVSQNNWRIDCGVSGYDNTGGLPPFLPTKLRCEDYAYRLWSRQHADVATVHVDAIQSHYRDPYSRESIPKDFHNEAHANFLKGVLRETLEHADGLTLRFGKNGEVSNEEARSLVAAARHFYDAAVRRAAEGETNRGAYLAFASQFRDAYAGFDADAFHTAMNARIRHELDVINGTMAAWPSILDAAATIPKPMRRMS
ncbi:MAG: hypothetical protein HYY37_05820 [Candidatus Aenigmarchaeota archaeon]|nr:hypothetical protein [Candidatus Aenigmarchaeota archaeon]